MLRLHHMVAQVELELAEAQPVVVVLIHFQIILKG